MRLAAGRWPGAGLERGRRRATWPECAGGWRLAADGDGDRHPLGLKFAQVSHIPTHDASKAKANPPIYKS
jgi:hypothetical protein